MKRSLAIGVLLLVLLVLPGPALAADASDSGYRLLTTYKFDSILQSAGDVVAASIKGRAGVETVEGRAILPFVFEDIEIVCSEDGKSLGFVASRRNGDDVSYELYDISGKQLLETQYDHALVSGEYVVLGIGVENSRQDGVYDFRTKSMVTPVSQGRISTIPHDRVFGRSLISAGKAPHRIFYNQDGEISFTNLPADLDVVGHFGKGYFQTSQRNTGRYGVCTIEGVVLPAEFEEVLLGDANFILRKDGLWGASDKQGRILIDFTFSNYDQGSNLFYNSGEGGTNFYTETGLYLATAKRALGWQGDVCYFENDGKIGGVRSNGQTALSFSYDGIGLPGHPYKGFTILYNESFGYNPKLDNRHGFIAVNSDGEIIVPQGRYAYLSSVAPDIVIDCYDENMKVVAQYTKDGKKIPFFTPPTDIHIGLIGLTPDLFISGVGIHPLRYNESNRYGAWKNGKFALLELQQNFGKPSSWAKRELQSARDLELIPFELDIAYKSPCTREEFCIYIFRTLEKLSEESLESLVKEYGGLREFPDCQRYEVSVAYTLGIVSGLNPTTFGPEENITREQAAAILCRTAAFLGIESNSDALAFKDSDTFSDYAKEAITFISSVKGDGIRVMTGVSKDRFDPRGLYTREQAILTLLRLYQSKA
jgi:hypothetical protein